MWPRVDGARDFTDPQAVGQAGGITNERPDLSPPLLGRDFLFTLDHDRDRGGVIALVCFIDYDRPYRRLPNQRQEFLPHGIGHIDHPYGLGPALPELGERIDLVVHVLPVPAALPRQVNVETLAVVEPAILRLVHAAAEGDLAALRVGDDAHLLVEHRCFGDRLAVVVDGHGHLHVERAVGDHRRQRLEPVLRGQIGWIKALGQHPLLDLPAEVVAPLDGGDLVWAQRAADKQSHPPVVGDELLDSTGRQRESVGREIASHAVIVDRTLQGWHVEQIDEVPVLVAVQSLPLP